MEKRKPSADTTGSARLEERPDDKDWVRSSEGQEALSRAREQAEEAIRQLQMSPSVLEGLVKRRFA